MNEMTVHRKEVLRRRSGSSGTLRGVAGIGCMMDTNPNIDGLTRLVQRVFPTDLCYVYAVKCIPPIETRRAVDLYVSNQSIIQNAFNLLNLFIESMRRQYCGRQRSKHCMFCMQPVCPSLQAQCLPQ